MLLIAIDLALQFLLFVVWGCAAIRFSRSEKRHSFRPRSHLVLLGAGLLFTAGKFVTLFILGSRDWFFVRDTITVHLILLGVPIAAALVRTIPLLWKLASDRQRDRLGPSKAVESARAEVPDSGKLQMAVFSVQAAGIGASVDFVLTLLFPMKSLDIWNVILIAVIFAALTGALWRLRKRRQPKWSRKVRITACVLLALASASSWLVWSSQASKLPGRMSMMAGSADYGGGVTMNSAQMGHGRSGMASMSSSDAEAVSVKELTGPRSGEPDQRFTLIAEKKTVTLKSGAAIEAWTYNGQLPGPELRVRQGDLVEVKLINKDIEEGVTIHWHGQDVPNAEDGVAGVTQDSVMPGQTYTYRFIARQVGSYWYHSHQQSSEQVKRGLFGTLIVLPKEGLEPGIEDITVMDPTYRKADGSEVNLLSPIDHRIVKAGTPVRLRLFNTGNWPKNVSITGVPFKVAAIDGTDINEPAELTNRRLVLAAGGRYDVAFTMPDKPVYVSTDPSSGMLLSADGKGSVPEAKTDSVFDPLTYGSPLKTLFDATSQFDRNFTMVFDNKLGFYDGGFERLFTINGEVFPNTPMLMVKEGDLVKTTFVNRSLVPHPMHLHGHHMLVLSRNGKPSTGSPWWVDTLNVDPGESYVVAFKADNPGLWMDHCHNLEHAAIGMTLHLSYEGVISPFEVGHATQNRPE
ncbi:multicopper oxidase family protein [Cohnella nanjingensis]|uniref:Multicopper oxidase domain-containing protein n=1 Tax=Cohnella nanjingensis TaxID=1387779 RepID=A0A7X0RWW6_9BACL|nr:multicopper oxidase family protein [Cohnella nanjingensis]MBB6673966.1 multicopper oxidase domain-containing protein [Cohnella nanjingensis]